MKEKIFGLDSPFFNLMSKLGDLMLLNLMWIVCSLPIVTVGASTTALLYTGMKLAKGRDGYVVRNFWSAFKSNFKQSTIIYLILLVLGGAFGFSAWYWMHQESNVCQILTLVSVAILIVWLLEVLFVFAVQAKFENTIGNTMKNALIMAVQNLPITLLCLVAWGLLLGLNYTFVVANVLTLVIGIGTVGWLLGMFYNLAFRRYIPVKEEQEASLEGRDSEKRDAETEAVEAENEPVRIVLTEEDMKRPENRM